MGSFTFGGIKVGLNLFGGVDKAGQDIVNDAASKVSGEVIPAGEQAASDLLIEVDNILTKQRKAFFEGLAIFRDDTLNAVEAKIKELVKVRIGIQ